MKKLFLYSSFTGNGDYVSEEFEKAGFELRKAVEKKKFPKSFFWSIMSGGFRAGFGLKGKLIKYDKDVSSFDKIVIGSPIWNGRFPPVMNAVIKETDFSNIACGPGRDAQCPVLMDRTRCLEQELYFHGYAYPSDCSRRCVRRRPGARHQDGPPRRAGGP